MPLTRAENELLDPKIEKSPTFCKFEDFDLHPQLNIKFWNPEEKTKKEKKMTLLDPKIEKSFTASKLKKFHPHPQLDIKFWNP